MKKVLILVLGFLLAPVLASAQGDYTEQFSDRSARQEGRSTDMGATLSSQQDDFAYIKGEISRLLIENKKLESEYQTLKQKLETLKEKAEARERDIKKAAPRDWEEQRSRERKINSVKALYDDVDKLRNDIMLKKSRTTYLSSQLIELEEKQRLWKLKESDLEYARRQLELDIKMLQYELDEMNREHEEEVNELRNEIQGNLEMEREILSRVSAIEDGTYYSPQKAQRIAQENDDLEIRVKALEHEIEFQERENDILEKKRLLASKSEGHLVNKKLVEKQQLLKEVEFLRNQVEKLEAALDQSLKQKAVKDTFLKDFVELQQQNQNLRTELTDLEAKLNAIP